METKPRAIELAEFKDELLPSGRKLLHCIFKDKFGTSRYVWIPPWRGGFGVERLFFKAFEIEEWNDPEGAWSKELKEASKEVAAIGEVKLPVKVRLGEMAELVKPGELGAQQTVYRLAIEVIGEEADVSMTKEGEESFICVGDVRISCESLKTFLSRIRQDSGVRGISQGVGEVKEDWIQDSGWDGHWATMGARFWVWLETGLDRTRYQVIGRDVAAQVRSFVRKRLSDYRALKKSFDEA